MSYKIQYLTAKLQEEAAEVIQAVSKINRFGPQNSHPDRTTTNLQELVGELEDFLAIVAALEHYKYIDLTLSRESIANKAKALIQG
jgi:NTP pyrophosphatase (non-canonical NTP hydrolase)